MSASSHLLHQLKARSNAYEVDQYEHMVRFVSNTCKMESAIKTNISSYAQLFEDTPRDEFFNLSVRKQSLLLHCPAFLHVLARHAITARIITQLRTKLIAPEFTRNITMSNQFLNAHIRDQGALMRDYITNSPSLDFELCEKLRIRVTYLIHNPISYPIKSHEELVTFKRVLLPLLQPLSTRLSELNCESDNAWNLSETSLYASNDFCVVMSRQIENIADVVNHIIKSCDLSSQRRGYFNSWSTLSTLKQLKPYFCSHVLTTSINAMLEEVLQQTTVRTSYFHRLPLDIVMQQILLPIIQQTVDDTYDLPEEYMDLVDDINEQCGSFESIMKSIQKCARKHSTSQ